MILLKYILETRYIVRIVSLCREFSVPNINARRTKMHLLKKSLVYIRTKMQLGETTLTCSALILLLPEKFKYGRSI